MSPPSDTSRLFPYTAEAGVLLKPATLLDTTSVAASGLSLRLQGESSKGSTACREPPYPLTSQGRPRNPEAARQNVAEHRRSASPLQGAPYPPGAREAGRGTAADTTPAEPHYHCSHLSLAEGSEGTGTELCACSVAATSVRPSAGGGAAPGCSELTRSSLATSRVTAAAAPFEFPDVFNFTCFSFYPKVVLSRNLCKFLFHAECTVDSSALRGCTVSGGAPQAFPALPSLNWDPTCTLPPEPRLSSPWACQSRRELSEGRRYRQVPGVETTPWAVHRLRSRRQRQLWSRPHGWRAAPRRACVQPPAALAAGPDTRRPAAWFRFPSRLA